jgi:hypothetical protein
LIYLYSVFKERFILAPHPITTQSLRGEGEGGGKSAIGVP